jgi:hypothetical protein
MLVQALVQLDEQIRQILTTRDPEKIKVAIKKILEDAATRPGRASKLQAAYILERMSELAQDMCSEDPEFDDKFMDISRWIEKGLVYTNYLIDPETKGKYLATFDQTIIKAKVPDPKDPKAAEEREKRAGALLDDWNRRVTKIREQAPASRRPGSNLIIPGSSF